MRDLFTEDGQAVAASKCLTSTTRRQRNGEPEAPVNDRHCDLFCCQVDHAGAFFDHPERVVDRTRSLNGHHPRRLRHAVARSSVVGHVHGAVLQTPPTQ
jgi:hypothetical protein